mmetsp:Transcript_32524/g.75957  ORF Transcript_32524/g.75957 Transcript_32524/m.75957 type:complete len:267 (-) Transcript_32524:847-1647(-)
MPVVPGRPVGVIVPLPSCRKQLLHVLLFYALASSDWLGRSGGFLLFSVASFFICGKHEVFIQELSGTEALAWVMLRAPSDKAATVDRDRIRDRRQLSRHADLENRCHQVVEVTPRRVCSRHLNHQASEAPNVTCSPIARMCQDLRRHPWNGAFDGHRCCLLGTLGAAEICELRQRVEADEDVGTLDVTMQDVGVLRVQILQTKKQLLRVPCDQRLLQRPEIRKDLRKRTAGHILQVHLEVVISPMTAVVGDDVRMPQAPHHLNLVL